MWVVLSCNGQLGSVRGRETERDRRCGRRKKGWRRFEGKMEGERPWSGVCVGLRKEDDGGTGCEIGGLCRQLKRKNLQNQRRGGGGGSP